MCCFRMTIKICEHILCDISIYKKIFPQCEPVNVQNSKFKDYSYFHPFPIQFFISTSNFLGSLNFSGRKMVYDMMICNSYLFHYFLYVHVNVIDIYTYISTQVSHLQEQGGDVDTDPEKEKVSNIQSAATETQVQNTVTYC